MEDIVPVRRRLLLYRATPSPGGPTLGTRSSIRITVVTDKIGKRTPKMSHYNVHIGAWNGGHSHMFPGKLEKNIASFNLQLVHALLRALLYDRKKSSERLAAALYDCKDCCHPISSSPYERKVC